MRVLIVWAAVLGVCVGLLGCENKGWFQEMGAARAAGPDLLNVAMRDNERAAQAARSLPTPPAVLVGGPADIPDWAVRAAEMVQQRVIVYTAQYRLAVANPQAAAGDVEKLAVELGGYVQTASAEKVTIRVPSDKFKDATARLERMGQLVSRDLRADDVSEEYVDLKMRLASSQAMLTRLKALLEKAPDAKQALEVEREIARVMTEIERLSGRIRWLENQVALSTITVHLQRLTEAPRPALLGRRLPFEWLRTLGVNALLDY